MSENNPTIAEIASFFGLEESELASLLESANTFPSELLNHTLEKNYAIAGSSPMDLFKKQDEVKQFTELQKKFTEICSDYADEVTLNTRSKALAFASTIIYKVGPANKRMKKVSDVDILKLRFPYEGDKERKWAFVCRYDSDSDTLQNTLTPKLKIILSVKQASLLALCTFNKLAEFAYDTKNKIILTPMARPLYLENDIPKMANALNANVIDVIKTINCSAQAGGHVLLESELHCSIVCYLVFTKNVKDKKKKLSDIAKMINKYLAAGKHFSKDKFKVYCKYSTDVIAEQIVHYALNKLPNNLRLNN